MQIQRANTNTPIRRTRAATAEAPAQSQDGFKPSAKDDFAVFQPSEALKSWAATAEVTTLPQMLEVATGKGPDTPFLTGMINGEKQTLTYAQANQMSKEVASGLVELGVQPGERVATLAENSPAWMVTDFGVIGSGAVHAALYRDSSADAIAFNLKNSKARLVVVDSDERLSEVLKVEKDLPELTTIVTMHDTELKSSKKLVSWGEMVESGKENLEANQAELDKRAANTKATDVALMIFTSGTTGSPKGVLHTHGSILSSVEGALRIVTDQPEVSLKDVSLRGDTEVALLPLSHIFERIVAYSLVAGGGSLVYPEGHKGFMDEVIEHKPTIMAGVPKLYNKIVDGVRAAAAEKPAVPSSVTGKMKWLAPLGLAGAGAGIGALVAGGLGAAVGGAVGAVAGAGAGFGLSNFLEKKTGADFLDMAMDASEAYYNERDRGELSLTTRAKHALAKKLVYSKTSKELKNKIGENARIMISGGAPLPDRTAAFFWDNGLQLSNGYGTSEIGVTSINPINGQRLGTVGPSISSVEMAITPDQDLNGDGEIRFRGPNLMLGYLNDTEKTASAFDQDGFYLTGDIGNTDEHGHLRITGRLKNFIALATGKKIASEPLEEMLEQSPYISQAVVVGEGRPHVGALVVPDFQQLATWARENGHSDDPTQMATNPAVKEFLQSQSKELTSGNDRHEQVWKLAVIPRELQEHELAKGEPKRHAILEEFGPLVDSIYE